MQKQKILSFIIFFTYISFMPAFCWYGGSFAQLFKQEYAGQQTSFLLTKLAYESDIPFGNDEFLYLTELKVDSLITKKHVDRAYRQLMAKKRFSHIDIDIQDYENGKQLIFKLTGNWVFKKLSLSGILFGKQVYTNLYTQHPGDIFDGTLHDESVKAIKAACYDRGYFASTVRDELIYTKKTKTITAKIVINRGYRFSIEDVVYKVIDEQNRQSVADIKLLHKVLNDKFSSELINKVYAKQQIEKQVKKVRDFLTGNNFSQVQISMCKEINQNKKTVRLIFTVGLGKKKVLNFTGNTVFSAEQIKNEILGQESPDWLFADDIISEQIRYEYYKKGYWDVSLQGKKLGNFGYDFSIKEGGVTFIEQVEVKDYATQLPEQGLFFWPDLLQRRQFDQLLLDDGIEKLRNFYQSNGYWDFRIVDTHFLKNHDTGEYTIQIFIDKGKQRLFDGFSIEGFKKLETDEFFKKYKLPEGDQRVAFNFNWLSEQRTFLLDYFQKLNYWYVDVKPELKLMVPAVSTGYLSDQQVSIKVNWKVILGEQVKFGKVVVRGESRVPFKQILKEVRFKEGDMFKKEKLDLTRKKLKRLDVFKTVQLQPYQMAKNKSKKPIIFTLVDDDPVELRLKLGYFLTSKNFIFQQQSTPKVGTSFIIRNPTNRADKLSLNADWTRFERKLDVDYQKPSFLKYSVMNKYKGYTSKYIHPVRIGDGKSAYEAYQHGLLFGLNDEYKRDYHWGLSIGNEWIRTSRVYGYLNLDKSMIDRTLPYFFVEPSLIVDKLDDRINTKRGGLSIVSLKCMVPETHGTVTARLTAEQSFFYPVFKDVIFAAHVKFGHMLRREFNQVMPIDRFYLGGPYSVRGYEIDALPPLGVIETTKRADGTVIDRKEYTTNGDKNTIATVLPAGVTKTKEYTIQGGSSMIHGNLELRFPILKDFGAVLFQDIGVLSQSGFAGFKSVWYPASGFGLRYKTPIGALRFDIGWKWKRRLEHDRSYAWYLTLGEAF